MALNPGLMLRSTSPASSEGSPQRGRRGAKPQDESLTKDKGFRRYAAGVDRALGLFDVTLQEWADYISFLSRLLKTLRNHPEGVKIVPRKYIVAKRLAQCLHPSLPSGVHQKALEVYRFIFGYIREDGLAEDLAVYLPGIASTLTFASISVRPLFLSLIEEHVLKVPICALRPALKALILALLPGLEEETSDEFERTVKLLNQCKYAFRSAGLVEVFWQNLFLASITSSSRRQGVLVYLGRYLPELGKAESDLAAPFKYEASKTAEAAAVTTPEPGLLLRCFATGLADEQALVQRAFLDLLVTHLPLHAFIFHKNVVREDLELVVSAAVGVVLRRDMSLNRRLWSWFLGPELVQKPESEILPSVSDQSAQLDNQMEPPEIPSYFQRYGEESLIQTLEAMIAHDHRVPLQVSRPFRIALSLMDRWEIGSPVVNAIFIPLIRSLRAFQQNATSQEDFDEVFRSANVFFDGVESTLIWAKMLNLVTSATKKKEEILLELDLARFIIANFNVREEDMVTLHIPLVSLAMLENLSQAERPGSGHAKPFGEHEVQSSLFHLLSLMVDLIPDRAFTPRNNDVTTSVAKDDGVNGYQEKVKSFFDRTQDAVEFSEPPFSPETLGRNFLQLLTAMILKQIDNDAEGSHLSLHVQLLTLLLTKLPSYDGLDGSALARALRQRLAIENTLVDDRSFAKVASAAALFVSLFAQNSRCQIINSGDVSAIVTLLVRHLWTYLSFSSPQHHIETVHLLEDLQYLVWQEELVTSTILGLIVGTFADSEDSYQPSQEALNRYATLWTHSRNNSTTVADTKTETPPDLISIDDRERKSMAAFSSMLSHSMIPVLNVLRVPQTEVYASCRDWLQSLADLSSIFEAVVMPIRESLGLDGNTQVAVDKIEAGSNLMEILNQLVATQSREQWSRFLLQPGPTSYSRPSSLVKVPDPESLQIYVTRLCAEILQRHELRGERATDRRTLRLEMITLNLLRQLFSNSKTETLLEFQFDHLLIAQLGKSVVLQSRLLQSDLLDTLLLILNSKITISRSHEALRERSLDGDLPETRQKMNGTSPVSSKNTLSRRKMGSIALLKPPEKLLHCLLKGIGNLSSRDVIQKWIQLVCESIYFYSSSIFSILMKVVECFCEEIELCFGGMKTQYQTQTLVEGNFETPLSHILNGLDFVLARAHEQLLVEEDDPLTTNSPEPQPGFFGNIVSGAVSSEAKQARNNTNNNRLTVILCFQDALRACFRLWSWHNLNIVESSGTLESFHHASQKIRARSRRILEHLLAAEPLESIESLAHIWVKAIAEKDTVDTESLLDLVHTLQGSRPGITMSAIFNAIYTRTNPTALVLSQRSTLSSHLQESDLVAFLSIYTQSLEDDVLEEIWKNCTTFLRDVLANPMPHRQILTRLINFIAILTAKMENTNFGEERKMRRELADLFIRLLTAIFTIKPQNSSREKSSGASVQSELAAGMGSDSVEQILDQNFAALSALFDESDRFLTVMANVVSNIIAPLFRSRQFPQKMTTTILSLLLKISRIQNASKAWKKELTDSFNDARFFSSSLPIAKDGWLPLLRQLAFAEKGLMPELLSRFNTPTAAGIMFGVGTTAARLETDKRAQLNLRRLSCVLLAAENDAFAAHIGLVQVKMEELLTASSISSPSSTTRAEIYLVIRALVLKSSTGQMATFWPTVNAELHNAFNSVCEEKEDSSSSAYNNYSLLQAAKLLDVLLLTSPEDFQPQEWLFVTDTVDAIYRPEGWEPTALIDQVAQSMMEIAGTSKSATTPMSARNTLALPDEDDQSLRKPWLSGQQTRALPESDIQDTILRPFFGQLSIHVYERTYSLSDPDLEACRDDLLADLFNERTIVGF